MQYIFLDTNIFIHFVDFEQIDWTSITNSPDVIVITLAPIVIDELDKHKYNKNQRISRRVKKLLPKIESSFDNPEKLRYQIKLVETRPSEITFIENNLDKAEQDDSLLAAILEFKKKITNLDKIIYITNDVGPRLKAKSLNISVQKLNEEFLLPIEPDELEIKNLTLQKELHELKNKTPDVKLCFLDKSNLKIFKRENLEYSKEEFIKKEIELVKKETPFLVYNTLKKDIHKKPLLTFAKHTLFSLSESQVNDYNKELNEYFTKCENYANELFVAFDFRNHSIKIEFLLVNTGTAPAHDIDIEIHFPDGFELITENDLPMLKKKPIPPYKPKNITDYNFHINPIARSIINPASNFDMGSIKLNQPTIKKTNSYNVSYHLNSLKHNQNFELEPLYAKFNNIGSAKGFKIEYKLIISNLASQVVGQLNINLQD